MGCGSVMSAKRLPEATSCDQTSPVIPVARVSKVSSSSGSRRGWGGLTDVGRQLQSLGDDVRPRGEINKITLGSHGNRFADGSRVIGLPVAHGTDILDVDDVGDRDVGVLRARLGDVQIPVVLPVCAPRAGETGIGKRYVDCPMAVGRAGRRGKAACQQTGSRVIAKMSRLSS